MAPDIYIQSK